MLMAFNWELLHLEIVVIQRPRLQKAAMVALAPSRRPTAKVNARRFR